ncbi:MAG: hypothetical protein H0X73_12225 [Chthoniobacterales bacterium]|nr:hypothetical protein [Chthoniobacterales bacterium]
MIDARANADFLADNPATSKWGEYKLPESEKQALVAELNLSAEQIPSTYLEYLKWIGGQGANVYMNSTMNLLNGTATKLQTQPKVPPFIVRMFVRGAATAIYSRAKLPRAGG